MRLRSTLILLAFTALLLASPSISPTAAQTDLQCFAETGFCIGGPIRAYWERNGGLAVFGFPITDRTQATVEGRALQVQWFERDRLEIQPDGTITTGRLGVERLTQIGTPWQPGASGPAGAGCVAFPETGYEVCGPFAQYWRQNGGLARFGLPITGAYETTIEGKPVTVQYFERRRFELHNGAQVLLGLLGREVLAGQGTQPVAPAPQPPAPQPPTPTPAPQPTAVPAPTSSCHPSYPDVCIPPPPPDLDCGDIPYRRFRVVGSDPHRFDGDNDGIGCER
jgi:hypothetical protein